MHSYGCSYPIIHCLGLHNGGKIKEIFEHLHAKYRTSKCQSNRLGSKIKEILECLKTCMLNVELPSVNKTDVMANIKIYRFGLFEGA